MTRDVWTADVATIRQLKVNVGARTAGELADHLNALTDEERARLLDEADVPLQVARSQQAFQDMAASSDRERRDEAGRALLLCAADGCKNFPADQNGAAVPVNVRRWFCELHRHLSQPGDDEEWAPGIGIDPSGGGLVDLEERAREAARAERDARRLAERRAGELASRQAEAAELGLDVEAPLLADNLPWTS